MRNQANKATPDRRLEQIDGYHGIVCGTLEIGQYHYMGTDKKPIKAEERAFAFFHLYWAGGLHPAALIV